MPYSEKARFDHHRREPPERFDPSTFRNVSLSHTDYAENGGKKYDVPGAEAVVGKHWGWRNRENKEAKKARKEGRRARKEKEKIQTILTPKDEKERRVYRP